MNMPWMAVFWKRETHPGCCKILSITSTEEYIIIIIFKVFDEVVGSYCTTIMV